MWPEKRDKGENKTNVFWDDTHFTLFNCFYKLVDGLFVPQVVINYMTSFSRQNNKDGFRAVI